MGSVKRRQQSSQLDRRCFGVIGGIVLAVVVAMTLVVGRRFFERRIIPMLYDATLFASCSVARLQRSNQHCAVNAVASGVWRVLTPSFDVSETPFATSTFRPAVSDQLAKYRHGNADPISTRGHFSEDQTIMDSDTDRRYFEVSSSRHLIFTSQVLEFVWTVFRQLFWLDLLKRFTKRSSSLSYGVGTSVR